MTNMKTFEATLFQKSLQYFIIKVSPYKISLQKSLVKIALLSGVATPELNNYAVLLKNQVAVLDAISKCTSPSELSELLIKYVYLKKEIE